MAESDTVKISLFWRYLVAFCAGGGSVKMAAAAFVKMTRELPRGALSWIESLTYVCSLSPPAKVMFSSWWRHQMETFSALLALSAGNSPATGEFPAQKPVTRSFDVFVDLRLNKRLSKQPRGWWFETPSWSLWRHCNVSVGLSVCYQHYKKTDERTWNVVDLSEMMH